MRLRSSLLMGSAFRLSKFDSLGSAFVENPCCVVRGAWCVYWFRIWLGGYIAIAMKIGVFRWSFNQKQNSGFHLEQSIKTGLVYWASRKTLVYNFGSLIYSQLLIRNRAKYKMRGNCCVLREPA